jgi:hypothetical protein
MRITDKNLACIDEYLTNGFQQVDAYLKVYGNDKKESAAVRASILFSKPEIQAILKEKQKEVQERVMITKEDIVKDLIKIKDLCFTDKKAVHNSIKALETINKMLGLNEPEKVDVRGSVDFNIKDLVKFED